MRYQRNLYTAEKHI